MYTRSMPAKNTIKTYVEGGIYHVYNRGVEKRTIFEDEYDYRVFLNCFKEALLPPEKLPKTPIEFTLKGDTFKGVPKRVKNFFGAIDLLAYCLMPNHFHLLIKQQNNRVIDSFMRSIATRYSIYFNKRYKRVGPLFQGAYKAALIVSDVYLLHLSRYIHRNPLKIMTDLVNCYSSYAEYLGKRKIEWVKPEIILASFQPTQLPFLRHINSYKKFVEYEAVGEDILTVDEILESDDF